MDQMVALFSGVSVWFVKREPAAPPVLLLLIPGVLQTKKQDMKDGHGVTLFFLTTTAI